MNWLASILAALPQILALIQTIEADIKSGKNPAPSIPAAVAQIHEDYKAKTA